MDLRCFPSQFVSKVFMVSSIPLLTPFDAMLSPTYLSLPGSQEKPAIRPCLPLPFLLPCAELIPAMNGLICGMHCHVKIILILKKMLAKIIIFCNLKIYIFSRIV